MSNFDYVRGRTEFFLIIELVASCLSFPTRLIALESEFYAPDIGKNLRRGQTVTIGK
jgi:hypothetical protein